MKVEPRYKKGDKIANRYRVHQALMGGMGEVYLCLDLETNLPYALKTFQQRYLTDTQRLRQAFEQEVATWVALEKHPNIVRCFYMDTLNNQPFMMLEWVAGEEGRGTDLRSWLRHGPLDLQLALQIAIDICNGLLHAQTKRPGLVHRDLKPENILMAQGGLAKLTDFGLVQIVQTAGLVLEDAGVTNDSAAQGHRQSLFGGQGIVGTPAYMAPEQWRSESLDERTDIYALGCILYELLTGSSPFTVDFAPTTPLQMKRWLEIMQQTHETTPYPKLPVTFAPAIHELLANCLAKAQQERPTDLNDLIVRLTTVYRQQFDQHPPVRPEPDIFTAVDYNNRGNTYHALGQHAQALADYTQAIALDPNLARAYNNRGNTYATLGQDELALADYDYAIALKPDDAIAYSNRGLSYAELGQHAAALDDYIRATELDPNLAQAYANRGNTYHSLGQHELALADYGHVFKLDPNLAQAYINRGKIYADLDQYELALADDKSALELDPNLAQAYINRGNAYHALGQHELAVADYSHVIALEPNDSEAYYNRATTYHELGQYELALADFSRAIEINPNLTQAYFNRGVTWDALGQHAAALADYSHTLELDPNDAKVYTNRGATYKALGQFELALSDFDRALELDPGDARTYYNRGVTYKVLGQHAAALTDYGCALELDPQLAEAYVNIGVLLGNQGQLAEALAYFEQGAQLGNLKSVQYAARARQMLGLEPTPQIDLIHQAFAAFADADSIDAMHQMATCFPLLVQADFVAAIEQLIIEQVSPEDRPAFTQRLAWLRQIASTQPRSIP